MSEMLKVVIVGSGDMGGTHLRGYAALDDVQVAAVADPDLGRAGALAEAHRVPKTYADYHEAIQTEKPDMVSVCVPAFLHCEVALYAMEQGYHVLCEKPIALTLEDGQRMAEASERLGGRLGMVFQRRYLEVWKEVERRLPLLGEPLSYQVADFRPVRTKRLMHSRSGNGGPVIDCCVHDFDMAMRLFGPAESVYAVGGIYARDKAELTAITDLATDTANISIRFANNHTALLSYCWGLPTGFRDISRTEILGPNGILRIDSGGLEHHMGAGRIETVAGLDTNGHSAQVAAFVHALRNNKPLPVAPHEAFQALRVAHAALQSIVSAAPQHLA